MGNRRALRAAAGHSRRFLRPPFEELENAFSEQADNPTVGILLYQAQSQRGDLNGALATLRVLEKSPDCPKYVYYLEAQLWAQQQQWELAWTAWWNYHATGRT